MMPRRCPHEERETREGVCHCRCPDRKNWNCDQYRCLCPERQALPVD